MALNLWEESSLKDALLDLAKEDLARDIFRHDPMEFR